MNARSEREVARKEALLSGRNARAGSVDRALELMAAVPPALRLAHGRGKQLLKQAMREQLPDAVLSRPKMGFGVPLEAWFRDDLAGFVREILLDRRTVNRGIFSAPALERLIRRQATLTQLTPHLWAVLVFEIWCRLYLDDRACGHNSVCG